MYIYVVCVCVFDNYMLNYMQMNINVGSSVLASLVAIGMKSLKAVFSLRFVGFNNDGRLHAGRCTTKRKTSIQEKICSENLTMLYVRYGE